jgi:hypothetical protein
MSLGQTRGKEIREFILLNIEKHKQDIAALTVEKFAISRQAVLRHIRILIGQGLIQVSGTTKSRKYSLTPLLTIKKKYQITPDLEEDVVWRNDIFPLVKDYLSRRAIELWQHCFTEILNNAIDHSGGSEVFVNVFLNALDMEVAIIDNGEEGIFKKIQRELSLNDERHAILELSKGKLTTDPARHSGEGIFFSSRMVDRFVIMSGGVYFSHNHEDERDWIFENEHTWRGTHVLMKMQNDTDRVIKDVFDKYASEDDDFGFTKTIVPVRLAQYGNELLVSRSQAKRLLARVDRFKTVILDFEGITEIGQAFADEIFRVFTHDNEKTSLLPINMNKDVEAMVARAHLSQALE